MKPNIKIGDIIWSESYKSCGIILEEANYDDHSTDYYVFIFDDVYMSKFRVKPKDNIVIHNEELYGKTWWIKGKEYGL